MTTALTHPYEPAPTDVAGAARRLARAQDAGPALLFVEDSSSDGTACAVMRWPGRDPLLADLAARASSRVPKGRGQQGRGRH